MSEEMRAALDSVRDFLEGTGGDWDWDDFLSVPARDPNAKRLQGFCRQLTHDFPPETRTEYCSRSGMERLRAVLDETIHNGGVLPDLS